jgi:hypothetical protein
LKKLPELTASPLPSFLDHMTVLVCASLKMTMHSNMQKLLLKSQLITGPFLWGGGGGIIIIGTYVVGGKSFILKSYVLTNESTEEHYQ